MTLFEALTGGAFDRLNWQYSGEFDQNFSKKSNASGFARGEGGMGGFGIDRYISSAVNLGLIFHWLDLLLDFIAEVSVELEKKYSIGLTEVSRYAKMSSSTSFFHYFLYFLYI